MPEFLQTFLQLFKVFVRAQVKNTNPVVQNIRVGQFTKLLQQMPDFIHLNRIGVNKDAVILQIGIYLEAAFFRFFLLLLQMLSELIKRIAVIMGMIADPYAGKSGSH